MNTTIAGQCENRSPLATGSPDPRAGASQPDGASARLVSPTGALAALGFLCDKLKELEGAYLDDMEGADAYEHEVSEILVRGCAGAEAILQKTLGRVKRAHERAVRRASRANDQGVPPRSEA